MTYELPELGFEFNALEPHIDARTMEIHYSKHHAGYVAKANAVLEKHPELAEYKVCDLLRDPSLVPEESRQAFLNNGGGHCNHWFFWSILKPGGASEPSGALADAINEAFGSFDGFKAKFAEAAATRFGSGWAWLVIKDGKLDVISTANQDSALTLGYNRIIGLDVWEHAYYLNYQNRRPDYIDAFWNVVNWDKAGENFEQGGA